MYIELTVMNGGQLIKYLFNQNEIIHVRPHADSENSEIKLTDGRSWVIKESYDEIRSTLLKLPTVIN